MKINRIILAAVSALLICALCFAGCSAQYSTNTSPGAADSSRTELYEVVYDDGYDMGADAAEIAAVTNAAGSSIMPPSKSEGGIDTDQHKLLYTADVSLETQEYDAGYAALVGLIESGGGYISYSHFSNRSSHSNAYCRITAQIPAANYSEFIGGLSAVGNVTNLNQSVDDATIRYVDTQARVDTLKTQETRLLELLEQAENVTELLEIESRLAEVRYQIESYTAQLRTIDRQTAYSTVDISLYEVLEYTDDTEAVPGFGSRISKAIRSAWRGFLEFMQGFLIALVYALPFLLLAGIILVAILIPIRISRRRKIAARGAQSSQDPAPSAPPEKPAE